MDQSSKANAVFIASTGQHVGKTTTCLGIFSGLQKRYRKVGYMKPIGQQHVKTKSGLNVDKDVVLFRNQFHLDNPAQIMSPVLFPKGFTRDYLDHKVDERQLAENIQQSYQELLRLNECLLVEGTGHVGVGSIINLNNAKVAALLNIKVIIVASGGLGSSFDAMSLNKIACDQLNVSVAGVILNRVLPEKREMIIKYMSKALERWNIPLLGCIPYDSFLSNLCMQDFEHLFQTALISGKEHRFRHFAKHRLIATSVERYKQLLSPSDLIITPANRDDIILATLSKHWETKIQDPHADLSSGLILTGNEPPRQEIVHEIIHANIPMLYVPLSSYRVMEKITSYTSKLRFEDHEKIDEAIQLVESHIDFAKLQKVAFHHDEKF